jgi:hypothetical protein
MVYHLFNSLDRDCTHVPTHNPIMIKIENGGSFLPFRLLFWNSHKPIKLDYTISYLFIQNNQEKNSNRQIQ